jgi:DNA-binding CsgD family transcriptional regulator
MLARELGCDHNLALRWANGSAAIPLGVMRWLTARAELLKEHPAPKLWRSKRGPKPGKHQTRDEMIVARLVAGGTMRALATEYGLSPERVRQIARQLGYSGRRANPPWPPEADKRLLELSRAGLPASLIAKRLGVTKNAVTRRLRRLGLPGRLSPILQKGSAELEAEARARLPWRQEGAQAEFPPKEWTT